MKIFPQHFTRLILNKIFSYRLHLGGHIKFAVPETRFFILGMRQDFCIYDLKTIAFYFKKALCFLVKTITSGKKILFVGLPLGIEKQFRLLLKKSNHYILRGKFIGVLTNKRLKLKFKMKIKPSLIFIFEPSNYKIYLKELSSLNIPLMGFVNVNDPINFYDFPIPGNINSLPGSNFVYNLFKYLFESNGFKFSRSKLTKQNENLKPFKGKQWQEKKKHVKFKPPFKKSSTFPKK